MSFKKRKPAFLASSSSSSSSSDDGLADEVEKLKSLVAEFEGIADDLDEEKDLHKDTRDECDELTEKLQAAETRAEQLQDQLDELETDNESLRGKLKRLREDCEQAEQHAREAEREAEELEQEAERLRVDLQQALKQVPFLSPSLLFSSYPHTGQVKQAETKLDRKRLSKADLNDALESATSRIDELAQHNKDLDDRERQRDPIYKRGKLLRDVCDPPRKAGTVGLSECYVEALGASIVLEITEMCCKPRPPLRCAPVWFCLEDSTWRSVRLIAKADISNAQLVEAILTLNKRNPSMMMQFYTSPHLWRDCLVQGPASNGSPESLSIVPRHPLHGESSPVVMNVSVMCVRFRDFDEEEDLFALFETQGKTAEISPPPPPLSKSISTQ